MLHALSPSPSLPLSLSLSLSFLSPQIGLMGLIEWEWLQTLATLEPSDIDYTDYVETAKRLIPELQDEVMVQDRQCL